MKPLYYLESPYEINKGFSSKREMIKTYQNAGFLGTANMLKSFKQEDWDKIDLNKNLYKVVKIFRKSARRVLLAKNLTREKAVRMVNSYANNKHHMVCFYNQGE